MNVMKVNWKGVFPAVTTQFRPDQSLDLPATLRHLDAMIDSGVHGLVMLGTVGENASLEYAEKLEVLRATVGHVSRAGAGAERRGGVHARRWPAASPRDAEKAGGTG